MISLDKALAAAEDIAGVAGNGMELPEHQEHILALALEIRRLRNWLGHIQGIQRLDLASKQPQLLEPLLQGDQREKVLLGGQMAFEEVAYHCRDALAGDPAPGY